jgi:hypothetical protein
MKINIAGQRTADSMKQRNRPGLLALTAFLAQVARDGSVDCP